MRLKTALLPALPMMTLLCACTSPPGADVELAGAPDREMLAPSAPVLSSPGWPGADPLAPRQAPRLAAGWTAEGHLAVFRAATGEVIAEAGGAAAGAPRDISVDPWQSRIVTLDGGTGEISSASFTDHGQGLTLGDRAHEAWVSGPASVLATPFGIVVFEDDPDQGPGWRLLAEGELQSPGVPAPRPASVATALLPDGRLRISALTYGLSGDAPDMRVAVVSEDGPSAPIALPLSASPVSAPLSARWVESAGGGQILDTQGGDVVVSTFAGSGFPAFMAAGVGPGIERLEQAVSFAGGTKIALMTSGAADVVVLGVGAGGAPECAAALDLPGEAEQAPLFFGRGLVVVSERRLLAATSSGVYAVAISGDCPPELSVDTAFDGEGLRGPLAASP